MKKYIAPEIAVSLFDSERVVTLVSDTGKGPAFDEAQSRLSDMSDKGDIQHTFTVNLGE